MKHGKGKNNKVTDWSLLWMGLVQIRQLAPFLTACAAMVYEHRTGHCQ